MKKQLASFSCLLLFGALFSIPVPSSAQSLAIFCEDDRPLQFKTAGEQLTGLAVEVVQEIQKRVGNTDPIKMVPWARGLQYLNEKPNVVLFSMGRTADRNELYQWVGPISEKVMGLYVKADSPIQIKSLDDAKKVERIGVYRDDLRDQYLTQAGFTNLERTNGSAQNYKMLIIGRIDMFASSEYEVADNGYTDVKLAFAFLKTQAFIALSKKTDPAVATRWNSALADMKKDGSFEAIFHKYYPGRDLPGPAITKF